MFCLAALPLWGKRLLPFWLCVATVFLVRHELDWRLAPGRFLEELAAEGATVIHGTGIVPDDPSLIGGAHAHARFPMRVTSLIQTTDAKPAPTFPSWSSGPVPPPAWGDEVEFTGNIEPIFPPRNPGEFDEPAYFARKGIFREMACNYPEENRMIASSQGNRLVAWGRRCRAEMERRLRLGLEDSPEISGLIETLALGLKKELPQEDRDLFQRTGTMHLFVVNGLHIALLAGVLRFILKPLGLRRRAFAVAIIPLLFAYALLTGLSPGSVRAAVMAAVVFGASFADRKPFSWNTFAAAALILLAWDTNELFQPGFQFSFGVVGAILLLASRFQQWMLPLGHTRRVSAAFPLEPMAAGPRHGLALRGGPYRRLRRGLPRRNSIHGGLLPPGHTVGHSRESADGAGGRGHSGGSGLCAARVTRSRQDARCSSTTRIGCSPGCCCASCTASPPCRAVIFLCRAI